MEKKLDRVAIQGIKASFHDEAAQKYFQENCKIIECKTFRETFQSLEKGEADFAVMAIENSLAGSLLSNYILLQEYDYSIVGEITLPIRLYLLAMKGVQFEQIKYVQSHPIAILQCREFLQDFPKIQVLEKNDTAACAKEIADLKLQDTVAIAGLPAAKTYDLEVLESRIETNKKNFTRFLVLSAKKMEIPEANKASLVFQVKNEIGSLAQVLAIFAKNHLNLSKIQSIPVLGKPNRYNFYIDIGWNNSLENPKKPSQDYTQSILEILPFISNLTVLGIYRNNHFLT